MKMNRLAAGTACSVAMLCGCATFCSGNPVKLRIGTYNIRLGGAMVKYDMKLLADDITGQKLDIVGLQEVDYLANRSRNLDVLKLLSEHTGMKHYRFTVAHPIPGGQYGTGILSKYPIEEYETVPLPATGSGDPRAIGRTVINVNGTRINYFNTHLEVLNRRARTWNIAVLEHLTTKYGHYVVTGDMNTADLSEFEVIKNAKFANNNSEYPTAGEAGIDNIIYSPEWKVLNVGVLDTIESKHSDHRMLWADMEYTPAKK